MCLPHLTQPLWIREVRGAAISKQWVNCLAQGQNNRFLPCQLWDLIQQLFWLMAQHSNHQATCRTWCNGGNPFLQMTKSLFSGEMLIIFFIITQLFFFLCRKSGVSMSSGFVIFLSSVIHIKCYIGMQTQNVIHLISISDMVQVSYFFKPITICVKCIL
jgi:hypothetical protein